MGKHRELFTTDEYQWFLKLHGAMSDPEQKQVFYESVIEKKEADSSYSLFTDFPKQEEEMSEKGAMAKRYCSEILEVLRRGKSA